MMDSQRLTIFGRTPKKLSSFLVQVDPGTRENVVIDAYADGARFDAPACALACESGSETAAMELVAKIHNAVVEYLQSRARRHQDTIITTTRDSTSKAPEEEETIHCTPERSVSVARRACRVCGCTDDHACEGGCSWVEIDLCSRCKDRGLS
jgi:hypothetical protein